MVGKLCKELVHCVFTALYIGKLYSFIACIRYLLRKSLCSARRFINFTQRNVVHYRRKISVIVIRCDPLERKNGSKRLNALLSHLGFIQTKFESLLSRTNICTYKELILALFQNPAESVSCNT